jgi:hypothetical protein
MQDLQETKQIDLTKLSINDIKAIAYDQIQILHQTQQNINILEQELKNKYLKQKELKVEKLEE